MPPTRSSTKPACTRRSATRSRTSTPTSCTTCRRPRRRIRCWSSAWRRTRSAGARGALLDAAGVAVPLPRVRQLLQRLAPAQRAEDVERLADLPDGVRQGHAGRRRRRPRAADRQRRAQAPARRIARAVAALRGAPRHAARPRGRVAAVVAAALRGCRRWRRRRRSAATRRRCEPAGVPGIAPRACCAACVQRAARPGAARRPADRHPLRRRAGAGAPQAARPGVPARRRAGPERDRRRAAACCRCSPRSTTGATSSSIDQRGTGRTAPLRLRRRRARRSRWPSRPTAAQATLRAPARAAEARCRQLPHGDLRFFTTTLAMQRPRRGARGGSAPSAVNLVGVSYGTRAALEYLRQFPQRGAARGARRRRAARHGAAGELLDRQPGRARRAARRLRRASRLRRAPTRACAPTGGACWRSLPRAGRASPHPLTGAREHFALTRELLLGAVRGAALPAGAGRGAAGGDQRGGAGRFEPLVGLATLLGARRRRAAGRWACTSRSSAPRTCRALDARRPTRRAPTSATTSRALYRARLRRLAARRGAGGVLHACRRAPAPMLLLSRRRSTRRRRRATASASPRRWAPKARARRRAERRPRRDGASAACATCCSASSTPTTTPRRCAVDAGCADGDPAAAGVSCRSCRGSDRRLRR